MALVTDSMIGSHFRLSEPQFRLVQYEEKISISTAVLQRVGETALAKNECHSPLV